MSRQSKSFKPIGFISLLVGLAFIIACGGAPAAPDPTQAPAAGETSPPTQAPVGAGDTPVPTSIAEPTTAPPAMMEEGPTGTLNSGLAETGPFFLHPSNLGNPQIFVHGTAPIGEGLLTIGMDREFRGNLAESWSISEDFTTWTFKLNQGVQFHKGYGEMTSEDVMWSMRQWGLSKHPRAGQLTTFWEERPGTETPDPYTVVVNSGEPVVTVIAQGWFLVPAGASTFIASKEQTDELGVDGASVDLAATGPWEIEEHRTAEFWKMRAVEDHWRKTPHFAELVFWEIPEESSRIAGFQTGQLDTFQMAFDSIPLVEEMEGARFMSIPDAVEMRLRIYGNWYPIPGVETRPGYSADLPWVSANPDVNSPEWERARKVREALHMAIDREGLVETILGGRGHTGTQLSGYTDFGHLLQGRTWPDFDPDGARALLAEAGYPDGFRVNLTTAIRGASNEVESCEAIAQMFNDIGLDVNFQRIPYGTLRPQLVGRTYQGITCHGGSPDPVPADGYGSYTSVNPFNRGLEHIYSEELMIAAQAEIDPAKREALESEIAVFLMDNYLTDLVYYSMDAVWPVGPRLVEWTEHVRTSDLRQINGYEYIQHRK